MSSRFWKLLTYRLPPRIDLETLRPTDIAECLDCPLTPANATKDQLFDNIIDNQYCLPLTRHDLAHFCEDIEISGENLQFYLDFLEYVKRWEMLSEDEKSCSPAVSQGRNRRPRLKKDASPDCQRDDPGTSNSKIAQSVNDDMDNMDQLSRYSYRGRTESIDSQTTIVDPLSSHSTNDFLLKTQSLSSHALSRMQVMVRESANIDWDPAPNLPLRDDVDRLVSTFLLSSSPRQLNLSYSDSLECLTALTRTSHPSALQPAADHIRHLLVQGTLPNFLRHSANNANDPRKWISMATSLITLAVVFSLTVLNVVQRKPKAMRAIGIPSLWFGMTCLLASFRGSCFILSLRHRVQIRPYHPIPSDENVTLQGGPNIEEESSLKRWKSKSLFARIFTQSQPTSGPFRHMQNAIAVQSIVYGFIITVFISILVALIPVLD